MWQQQSPKRISVVVHTRTNNNIKWMGERKKATVSHTLTRREGACGPSVPLATSSGQIFEQRRRRRRLLSSPINTQWLPITILGWWWSFLQGLSLSVYILLLISRWCCIIDPLYSRRFSLSQEAIAQQQQPIDISSVVVQFYRLVIYSIMITPKSLSSFKF